MRKIFLMKHLSGIYKESYLKKGFLLIMSPLPNHGNGKRKYSYFFPPPLLGGGILGV